MTAPTCCLCGGPVEPWPTTPGRSPGGYGNNPEPLASHPGRCCNDCNATKVIPARIGMMLPSGSWTVPTDDQTN
jgi:hypothetical protein